VGKVFWNLAPIPGLLAAVKQHPPEHHEGWMVSGQETVLCWVPVP